MTLVMPSGTWRRGVEDIHKTCEELRSKGAKVVREPGPMKHGGNRYRIQRRSQLLQNRADWCEPSRSSLMHDALNKLRLRNLAR
jgi:hypothetical protein